MKAAGQSFGEERKRHNASLVILHWVMALLILGNVALGFVMTEIPRETPARSTYFNLHKSVGLLLLVLFVARFSQRICKASPAFPENMSSASRTAARMTHFALYIMMLLQPTTGYLASAFGKYGVAFFGLEIPSWTTPNASLRKIFLSFHHATAIAFTLAIGFHIAAATLHYVSGRTDITGRMTIRISDLRIRFEAVSRMFRKLFRRSAPFPARGPRHARKKLQDFACRTQKPKAPKTK